MNPTNQRTEVLFIDANVVNAQSFVSDISSNIEVVLLDGKSNVINQIAAWLEGRKNIGAVHIISHGASGELAFANGSLNNANIGDYATQLKSIGNALTVNGDILLYGCDVAVGGTGLLFINQLSHLTSADVVASNDLTGNAALGGNWTLETATGIIESSAVNVAYDYVLSAATISGTPTQNQTLSASFDASTVSGFHGYIRWQWYRNDSPISGATSTTYVLTQDDVDATISVKAAYDYDYSYTAYRQVWVSSGYYGGTWGNTWYDTSHSESQPYTATSTASSVVTSDKTASVLNVNDLPTGSVTITDTPIQGQILTVSNTIADLDGLGAISYQWLRDGVPISGATQSNYNLTQDDVDKIISVTASYTDKLGSKESVIGALASKILNVNDPFIGSIVVAGSPIQNQKLTIDTSALKDLDGLGTFAYQWLRDSVVISGANQVGYTLTQSDVGKTVSVKVSQTDLQNTAESLISSGLVVGNVNDLPTGSISITGTKTSPTDLIGLGTFTYQSLVKGVVVDTEPQLGAILVANNDISDLDGVGVINYQWVANGVDIPKAIQNTYTLTTMDIGKEISVKANYVDLQNTSENVSSSMALLITGSYSTPIGVVSIMGDMRQNQTLTASNDLKDSNGLGVISYQWLRDGIAIDDANKTTYTLTQSDVGKKISVAAKYIDNLKNLKSKTSEETVTITNVNDSPTGSVSILGNKTPGQVLTVVNNKIVDADGFNSDNVLYQWFREETAIATGLNYTLTEADIAKTIKVKASYNDDFGQPETLISDGIIVARQLSEVEDSHANIYLESNDSITIQNNFVQILGKTSGNEIVTILEGSQGVVLNQNIDSVAFAKKIGENSNDILNIQRADYSDFKFQQAGNTLQIYDKVANLLATVTMQEKGTLLVFDNGNFLAKLVGKVINLNDFSLSNKPEAIISTITNMGTVISSKTASQANIFLNADDPITVANDGVRVFGNSGDEKVVLLQSAKNLTTDQAIERLTLPKNISDYTFSQTGNFMIVYDSLSMKIANVAIQEDGTLLSFSNGDEVSVELLANMKAFFGNRLLNSNPQTVSTLKITTTQNVKQVTGGQLNGGENGDKLIGNVGADTLFGNTGDDVLEGSEGNDSLDSGNGNDVLFGDKGNDTLNAGGGDDFLDGGADNDSLSGGAGNDTLDGSLGADSMVGGEDDDYYFVDSLADTVTELDNSGTDTVETKWSNYYVLGRNLENLILAANEGDRIDGTGNELNNTIVGNLGNNSLKGEAGNDKLVGDKGDDTLHGGEGQDTLMGGEDNDVYFINNTEDIIVEDKNGGTQDEIISTVNYSLSSAANVEVLTLAGEAKNAGGSKFNDSLQEQEDGQIANLFKGYEGNDSISSKGGDDTLDGGTGNDSLDGGSGDNDVAVFSSSKDNYQITPDADSSMILVTYIGTMTSQLNEGTDSLKDIELLQFAGVQKIVADWLL